MRWVFFGFFSLDFETFQIFMFRVGGCFVAVLSYKKFTRGNLLQVSQSKALQNLHTGEASVGAAHSLRATTTPSQPPASRLRRIHVGPKLKGERTRCGAVAKRLGAHRVWLQYGHAARAG